MDMPCLSSYFYRVQSSHLGNSEDPLYPPLRSTQQTSQTEKLKNFHYTGHKTRMSTLPLLFNIEWEVLPTTIQMEKIKDGISRK